MRAHDRRPLKEELVAAVILVLAHMIVGMGILKPQPVELTDIPGDERRIADRLFPGAEKTRRIVEEKSRRPALVELQLAVAVSAQGGASSGSIVPHLALV